MMPKCDLGGKDMVTVGNHDSPSMDSDFNIYVLYLKSPFKLAVTHLSP